MLGKIAYDTKLKRPGCAIVQAALGGDPWIANHFDTEDWLLAPTPDMAVYPVEDEEFLARLVAMTKSARVR